MAYLLLIGAGLRIALRTDRTFEKLLATGLTTIVGVQAFIIIGGVIKVVPLTGITLPFVSYGGSSLLSNYILARDPAAPQRLERAPPRRAARRPDAARAVGGWRLRRRARCVGPHRPPRWTRSSHDTRCVRHIACTGRARVNRQIRQLAVGLMAMYIVLFAALNYWQVGRTEELASEPSTTPAP